jgi:BspA type Leucine rich repeat region (6 copies)
MKANTSPARASNPSTLAGRLKIVCAARLLPLLFLTLPVVGQAQFTYITNNGTITITKYTGGGVVTIPSTTNGLPVTSIGDDAFDGCAVTSVTIPNSVTNIGQKVFYNCHSLTNAMIGTNVADIGYEVFSGCYKLPSITIPNSVTNIGDWAFYYCSSLTNVTIPNKVTSIGDGAFYGCSNLTSVTIGNSVTNIGYDVFYDCYSLTSVTIPNSITSIATNAFQYCYSLTNVTIPNSVTKIREYAFYDCTNLNRVYFQGNAPSLGSNVFSGDNKATVYYLPGTTGWVPPTFGGRPAVLWNPLVQTNSATFGVHTNRFGFTITGNSNLVIVVEVSANLANSSWTPISTNTLNTFIGTNGTSYFSDPRWTNYLGRFYRLRSP